MGDNKQWDEFLARLVDHLAAWYLPRWKRWRSDDNIDDPDRRINSLLDALEVGDKVNQTRNGRTTVSTVTAVETVDGITTVEMRPSADIDYGKNICGVYYEWQEEPGDQSRVLEWVRVCPKCGYSPDRH